MKPYQEPGSDDAYFFVEIPYINLEKRHSLCQELSFGLNLKYVSREEILASEPSDNIHKDLGELFTPQLNSYVEKYIENAEPVPIAAR